MINVDRFGRWKCVVTVPSEKYRLPVPPHPGWDWLEAKGAKIIDDFAISYNYETIDFYFVDELLAIEFKLMFG